MDEARSHGFMEQMHRASCQFAVFAFSLAVALATGPVGLAKGVQVQIGPPSASLERALDALLMADRDLELATEIADEAVELSRSEGVPRRTQVLEAIRNRFRTFHKGYGRHEIVESEFFAFQLDHLPSDYERLLITILRTKNRFHYCRGNLKEESVRHLQFLAQRMTEPRWASFAAGEFCLVAKDFLRFYQGTGNAIKALEIANQNFPLPRNSLIREFADANSLADFNQLLEKADEFPVLAGWIDKTLFYIRKEMGAKELAQYEAACQRWIERARQGKNAIEEFEVKRVLANKYNQCDEHFKAHSLALELQSTVVYDHQSPYDQFQTDRLIADAEQSIGHEQAGQDRDNRIRNGQTKENRDRHLQEQRAVEKLKQELEELKKLIAQADQELADKQKEIADRIAIVNTKNQEIKLLDDQIKQQGESLGELRRIAGTAWFSTLVTGVACLVLLALLFALWSKSRTRDRLSAVERLRLEAEQKLARHRRMDSLGLMAGSIAHDFNNILVSVTGNAELIEMADEHHTFTRKFVLERVKAIKSSASRAQKLAQQMLNYAGKQYSAQRTIDLCQLIQDSREVIESFGRDHQFEIQTCDFPVYAKVDETQIEQTLDNLINNAVAASPKGSKILIRTGTQTLDNDFDQDASYFGTRRHGGEFSFIEIEDSGCGISEHQLENIFEPYYSNSGPGRGLGLAVVYGIVESHKGLIHCDSAIGEGTRLRLLFPSADAAEHDSIDDYMPQVKADASSMEGRQVLIIDDEASVLDTCQQLLEQFGVESTIAGGGEEGLEILADQASHPSFDCILMDVVMPEMPAGEVLDLLEEKDINIPVILMSGFSPKRLDFFLKRRDVKAILPKPFGVAELRDAISKVVTGQSETHPGTKKIDGPNYKDPKRAGESKS